MCRELGAQQVEVLVVTTDAEMPNKATHTQTTIDYKGVPTIFFSSRWGRSFKFSNSLSTWLNQNVREFDAVHIHAVFNHACVAAARACRDNNVPYIIRPLGTLDPWSMKQKRFRKHLFWRLRGEEMLRRAAAVHYTTHAEQQAVEQTLRLNHGHVIPLGIDTKEDAVRPGRDELAKQLPDLNGHRYLLVLSRIHPKKGLDVLIDAFSAVTSTSRFSDWRLVIAGDGPSDYVSRLREIVIAKDATTRVLFPGWVDGDNKNRLLQHASLLVLTSYQENFGVCLLEAMACAVPVLVSPHVNLAEEIQSAGAGWVSEVDGRSLENALVDALGNDKERIERGIAGRELSKRFSWNNTATQLVQLYSSITAANQN
jgi:glycosyltransferase involved in cell wall biosynthesis